MYLTYARDVSAERRMLHVSGIKSCPPVMMPLQKIPPNRSTTAMPWKSHAEAEEAPGQVENNNSFCTDR